MEIATAFVAIRPQTDGFESELASALAGGDPVEVPVIAETGDAEAEIDGLEGEATVEAVADTGDAQAEIDSIEGGDAEVSVTANTEQAQEAIDQLADSSGGAASGLTQLGEASAAGAGAMREVGIGTLGAGAGLALVANAGIDAAAALERFNLIAGDNADALRSIDVGGLSGDIGDLALNIGSSDEAMLNATASFVTFAESSGAGAAEIDQASDSINALALRAVALNPGLGDAGAAAERLSGALARGGRPLRQFGIDLQSAEINARAMENTGKTSADQLTQFEKAAAGAQLATEQLGDTLGSDYAAGAENAALQTAAMKEQLGEAAEAVGTQMVPEVLNLADGVRQLAEGAANLDLWEALAGAWDMTTFGQIQHGISAVFDHFSSPDDAFANYFSDAADAVREANRALGEMPNVTLEGVIGDGAGARVIAGAFDDTAAAANDAEQAISDLAAEIDAYVNGIVSVPQAQRELRQSFDDLAEANASGTWDDQAAAMEDVVANTAALIQTQADLGMGADTMNATIFATLGILGQMRDSGAITADEFARLSAQVAGIPVPDPITTSTNAPDTQGQVDNLGSAIGKLPPITSVLFGNNAPANQGQVESLGAAAARTAGNYWMNFHIGGIGEAIAQLNNVRALKNTLEVGAAQGAGLGRPVDTGGGGGTIVVQTRLDGAVIAESVHRHNGYALVSEGYEP